GATRPGPGAVRGVRRLAAVRPVLPELRPGTRRAARRLRPARRRPVAGGRRRRGGGVRRPAAAGAGGRRDEAALRPPRVPGGESVVFAVVEGGRALGFTQLYPSFSSVSMRPIWILNDLFVAEGARWRGVGGRLLRAARDHATKTGAARLVLATAVTNAAAQAL